jgi:hypothetical protein
MSHKTKLLFLTATVGFVSMGAFGQSMDSLLDKLVDKGVLSVKEANDLREESDKDFTKAYSAKSGMPEWVSSFKWNGDFRARFEENNADDPFYHTRDRYRIRARLGAYVGFVDQFDVGIRLATGNPQTNPGGTLVGGAPMSANQDLNSLQSRKFIWLDAAYGRWTPLNTPLWYASGTVGKMDPFFQVSNMIWDYDIDPEGAALSFAHSFDRDQTHTIKLNTAVFILDELNQSAPAGTTNLAVNHDPFLLGAQLLWEANWATNMQSSIGVAMFGINSKDSLSALVQPFYNSGNTRNPTTGVLVYNYNPIVGSASFTYVLDSFPYYDGPFPIKPYAEFMHNTAAPKNNEAYRVGLQLGKAGKRHTWEFNYRYQRLAADAWFDALEDEDNGAFYATGNPQLAGTGKKNGWFGGTNVKGHLWQGTYSFTDYLNFTFTYYLNELIIKTPNKDSDAGHFMADLMWKF